MRENAKSFTQGVQRRTQKPQYWGYRYCMDWFKKASQSEDFFYICTSRKGGKGDYKIGGRPFNENQPAIPDGVNVRAIGKVLSQRLKTAKARLRKALVEREKTIEEIERKYSETKIEVERKYSETKVEIEREIEEIEELQGQLASGIEINQT